MKSEPWQIGMNEKVCQKALNTKSTSSFILNKKSYIAQEKVKPFFPREARFINLSRGVRARVAKGGQISIGPYIFRWCPHSCLATKPNRDR